MAKPIYTEAINTALRRLKLGVVDARHVEARIRETIDATTPLGSIVDAGGERWLTLVTNAAAAVQALPFAESEAVAQRWHL